MFEPKLRNLIQESNLQYLSPKRRREILSEATCFEVEKINQQIYDLFEWMDVEWYLDYWRITEYRKILLVYNLCESISEIDPILFHPGTEGLFNFPVSIFKKIISLCKNKQDFIKIAQFWIIERVLYSEEYHIFWIMLWYIKSVEELEILSDNNEFIYLCIYITSWNIIKRVLDFFDVKWYDDIIKIFNSWKWEHIKKIMRNWDTKMLEEVLSLIPEKSLIIPDNIIWFDKNLKVAACSDAEYFNMLILKERIAKNFIWITYKWIFIWYIKQLWSPSFLALRDVFTESWVLVIKKRIIYALNDPKKIVETAEISEQNQIQVNPIRMLNDREILNYMQSDKELDELIREFLFHME